MKYIELFKDCFDSTITEKAKAENYPYVGYSPNEGFAFTVVPKLQQNNEIWYTTNDGLIHEFNDEYIDANLVSNTYKDGNGVAKFDKDITRIWSDTFNMGTAGGYLRSMIGKQKVNSDEYAPYSSNLLTLSLPNSLIEIGDYSLSYNANWGAIVSADCPFEYINLGPNIKLMGGVLQRREKHMTVNFKGTLSDWVNINFQTVTDQDRGEWVYYPIHVSADKLIIDEVEIKGVLNIPEGITNINDYSFAGCANLTSLDLGNAQTIGNYAFWGCTGLTSITIPSTVTSIGASAFKTDAWIMKNNIINNSSLDAKTNNYWGAKVCDEITEDGLYILDSIIIAADKDKINKNSSLVVPEGITEIDDYVFQSSGLKNITIPTSVIKIGHDSFSWLSDFSITYLGTKDQWSKIEMETIQWTNQSDNYNMTIHCVDGDIILNTTGA